jgi:hypothetical protein
MSLAIESQGTTLEIGNGDSPLTYTNIAEIVNLGGLDGQAAEIDVTHLQSVAKEWLMGLQDYGTFNVDANYISGDTGQSLLRAAKASRAVQDFKLTFSDNETAIFKGYVLSASLNLGVDSKVDTSFSIRVTGDVTYS